MKSELLVVLSILFLIAACQHDPLINDMDMEPDPIDTTENPIDTTVMEMDTTDIVQPCNPDSVYFQKDVLPLLLSSCAYSGCHGDGSRQGDVELSNYLNIIDTGDIEPFNLSDSKLYRVITETDADKVMPPDNPLNSEQISIIAQWILQGATDNDCQSCDTINISFSEHIKPTIDTYCLGCHGATNPSGGLSLTSYLEINSIATDGSLLGVIKHETGFTAMPLNQPKLEDCLIQQISIWIVEGALEN